MFDKYLLRFIDDTFACSMISGIFERVILLLFITILLVKYKYKCFKWFKLQPYDCIILVLLFIVAINNFPFISLIEGNLTYTSNLFRLIIYFLFCLSIAFFEELMFRVIILLFVFQELKEKKQRVLKSILISSAIFGLVHLFNLFVGAGIGETLLQIGYSFLIGSMCAISFVMTGNILFGVLIHFIYNLGGLLTSYEIYIGKIWTLGEIIFTSVIGLIVFVLTLIYCIKKIEEKEEQFNICLLAH